MTSGKEGELDISPRGVPRSLTKVDKDGLSVDKPRTRTSSKEVDSTHTDHELD